MLDATQALPRARHSSPRYTAPPAYQRIGLADLLAQLGRSIGAPKQLDLLRKPDEERVMCYCAGDLSILRSPTVWIVGTRDVSEEGARRAQKLARELVVAGVSVMSGLARGVDTAAHLAAIERGGRTAAVIGTPLDKVYPAENARLQEFIYEQHLLISPFALGEATFKSSFPKRNRMMAMLSDATAIIEASDTSGTLHQAAECQRLGRWLFIAQSVAEDPSLAWPTKFLAGPKTKVLSSAANILDAISNDEDRDILLRPTSN